jgi:hypothetical protein
MGKSKSGDAVAVGSVAEDDLSKMCAVAGLFHVLHLLP